MGGGDWPSFPHNSHLRYRLSLPPACSNGPVPPHLHGSLAFPYNQAGLRAVLRSLTDGLTNLRENISFWSLLTLRDWVSKP